MGTDQAVGESANLKVDEGALRDLAARYATAVDAGDADGFASVFLPEGRIRMFRPGDGATPTVDIAGPDDLREVPASLARRYTATFHFVGHAVYEAPTEPDGDATGTVYCLAHHLNRETGTDHVMHIRYRDRYRRDQRGEWRILSREGAIPWTETRPVDSLPVPAEPETAR